MNKFNKTIGNFNIKLTNTMITILYNGQMVKAFDNVVFKKPILKVHGPVKTKFGYHLIKTIYRS